METNKAVEFNNQWVRLAPGQHRHPSGWFIRFNKQTRFWSVRRGLVGECELPQTWDNKPFRKLDDAKRAVNQFMKNNNYMVGR